MLEYILEYVGTLEFDPFPRRWGQRWHRIPFWWSDGRDRSIDEIACMWPKMGCFANLPNHIPRHFFLWCEFFDFQIFSGHQVTHHFLQLLVFFFFFRKQLWCSCKSAGGFPFAPRWLGPAWSTGYSSMVGLGPKQNWDKRTVVMRITMTLWFDHTKLISKIIFFLMSDNRCGFWMFLNMILINFDRIHFALDSLIKEKGFPTFIS